MTNTELENAGFKFWSNHPGSTIEDLNFLLRPFHLRIETWEDDQPKDLAQAMARIGKDRYLWFRVVEDN